MHAVITFLLAAACHMTLIVSVDAAFEERQTPEVKKAAEVEITRELRAASGQMYDFVTVAGNKAVHRELGFSEELASQVRKLSVSSHSEDNAIRLMKIDDLPADQREKLKNLAADAQKEQFAAIKADLRTTNREEHEAAVRKLVKPEDCDRIWQIRLRLRGSLQLIEPDLVETLTISDEQRQQIAKLNLRYITKANELPRVAGKEAAIAQLVRLIQERDEKALELLTDEQREKYDGLLGKPFDISTFIPPLPPGVSQDRQKRAAFGSER